MITNLLIKMLNVKARMNLLLGLVMIIMVVFNNSPKSKNTSWSVFCNN